MFKIVNYSPSRYQFLFLNWTTPACTKATYAIRSFHGAMPTFNERVDMANSSDRAYFGRKTLSRGAATAAICVHCDACEGRAGGLSDIVSGGMEGTLVCLWWAATLVFRSITCRCRPHHSRRLPTAHCRWTPVLWLQIQPHVAPSLKWPTKLSNALGIWPTTLAAVWRSRSADCVSTFGQ